MGKLICRYCGKPFDERHQNGRVPMYCSQRCRTKANTIRREIGLSSGVECTCRQCGKTFFWEPSSSRKDQPMYCTKRCGTIASHQRESYRIYQAAYYQEHKDARPPRPGKKIKLTPEERQEHRRIYQREYKRKQRALIKQGGKDHG